jgi:hypothetical protein
MLPSLGIEYNLERDPSVLDDIGDESSPRGIRIFRAVADFRGDPSHGRRFAEVQAPPTTPATIGINISAQCKF